MWYCCNWNPLFSLVSCDPDSRKPWPSCFSNTVYPWDNGDEAELNSSDRDSSDGWTTKPRSKEVLRTQPRRSVTSVRSCSLAPVVNPNCWDGCVTDRVFEETGFGSAKSTEKEAHGRSRTNSVPNHKVLREPLPRKLSSPSFGRRRGSCNTRLATVTPRMIPFRTPSDACPASEGSWSKPGIAGPSPTVSPTAVAVDQSTPHPHKTEDGVLDFTLRWRAPRLQKRSTSLDSGDWDEQTSNRSLLQPSPASSHSSWSRLPEEELETACKYRAEAIADNATDMAHCDFMDLTFQELTQDPGKPTERDGSVSPTRRNAMREQYRRMWELRATFEEQDDDDDDISIALDFPDAEAEPSNRVHMPMVEEKCWKYLDTLRMEHQVPENGKSDSVSPCPEGEDLPKASQESPSTSLDALLAGIGDDVSEAVSRGYALFDHGPAADTPRLSRFHLLRDSSFDSVDTDSSTSDASRLHHYHFLSSRHDDESMGEDSGSKDEGCSSGTVDALRASGDALRPHPYRHNDSGRMRSWRSKRRDVARDRRAFTLTDCSPANANPDFDAASPSPTHSPSLDSSPRNPQSLLTKLLTPTGSRPRRYVHRDFSIDKQSDKLFREFSRCDPAYDPFPKMEQASVTSRRRPPPDSSSRRGRAQITPQDSIEEEEEHDSSKVSKLSLTLKK